MARLRMMAPLACLIAACGNSGGGGTGEGESTGGGELQWEVETIPTDVNRAVRLDIDPDGVLGLIHDTTDTTNSLAYWRREDGTWTEVERFAVPGWPNEDVVLRDFAYDASGTPHLCAMVLDLPDRQLMHAVRQAGTWQFTELLEDTLDQASICSIEIGSDGPHLGYGVQGEIIHAVVSGGVVTRDTVGTFAGVGRDVDLVLDDANVPTLFTSGAPGLAWVPDGDGWTEEPLPEDWAGPELAVARSGGEIHIVAGGPVWIHGQPGAWTGEILYPNSLPTNDPPVDIGFGPGGPPVIVQGEWLEEVRLYFYEGGELDSARMESLDDIDPPGASVSMVVVGAELLPHIVFVAGDEIHYVRQTRW